MKLLSQAPAGPTRWFHFAPSALDDLLGTPPGALPQAITFRAFGAFKRLRRKPLMLDISVRDNLTQEITQRLHRKNEQFGTMVKEIDRLDTGE